MTEGQELGLKKAWFYAGWQRALRNLPQAFGYHADNEDKIVWRFLGAQCKKDLYLKMGWWPNQDQRSL